MVAKYRRNGGGMGMKVSILNRDFWQKLSIGNRDFRRMGGVLEGGVVGGEEGGVQVAVGHAAVGGVVAVDEGLAGGGGTVYPVVDAAEVGEAAPIAAVVSECAAVEQAVVGDFATVAAAEGAALPFVEEAVFEGVEVWGRFHGAGVFGAAW